MGKLIPRREKRVPKLHVSGGAGSLLQSPDSQFTLNLVPHISLSCSSSAGKARSSKISILSVTCLELDRPGCPWQTCALVVSESMEVSRPCPRMEEQNVSWRFIKAQRGFNLKCEKGSELGFVWKGSFWAFISPRFIISPCFASHPSHASHYSKKSTWWKKDRSVPARTISLLSVECHPIW